MRKVQAITLLHELEERLPGLHFGINAFLEEPSSCSVPEDVGWKALVDESVANLQNIKEIEEAAARYWLKTRWVHRNVRHLLKIYTPKT
jgi:hypothetical protein